MISPPRPMLSSSLRSRRMGMLALLLQVVRTESLLGLWKGMSPVSCPSDLLFHPLLHNQPFLIYLAILSFKQT